MVAPSAAAGLSWRFSSDSLPLGSEQLLALADGRGPGSSGLGPHVVGGRGAPRQAREELHLRRHLWDHGVPGGVPRKGGSRRGGGPGAVTAGSPRESDVGVGKVLVQVGAAGCGVGGGGLPCQAGLVCRGRRLGTGGAGLHSQYGHATGSSAPVAPVATVGPLVLVVVQGRDGGVDGGLGDREGRPQDGEDSAPQGPHHPPAYAPLPVDEVGPQDCTDDELDDGDEDDEAGDPVPEAGDLWDPREEVPKEEVVQIGDVHVGEGGSQPQDSHVVVGGAADRLVRPTAEYRSLTCRVLISARCCSFWDWE